MNPDDKKPKVLIVDDVPENLVLLEKVLTLKDIDVSFADNGQDALIFAEKEPPDLILLDIAMPGMDGFEVCIKLKENDLTKEIPVIFLTASRDEEETVRALEMGAVDFVSKPFSSKELMTRVITHIELYRAKREIDEANIRLNNLCATKDKFISLLSHDLRGVLSNIAGYAKILMDEGEEIDGEQIKKFTGTIFNTASGGYSLLENVLKWVRSMDGKLEPDPGKLNLREVVNTNIVNFKDEAEKKNISLLSDIDKKIIVFADGNMLDTVLRNLISNAVKFTEKGGEVRIIARDTGDKTEISVIDNGTGIKQEDIDRLFRVDENFSSKGTDGEPGSGFGLILCREFVEKNNGEIRVESREGEGSAFIFTVPSEQ